MKNLSFNIALSGILSAVCLLMMFLVAVFPFFLYVFPMICGLIVYMIYYECGLKSAVASYFCISILSLLISPDKESALLFMTFFGYYAFAKVYIERMMSKLLKLIIKLAVFNLSILGTYFLLINVFALVPIEDFTGDFGEAMIWGFLLIANFVFLLYDLALRNVMILYKVKLRKLFFKRAR